MLLWAVVHLLEIVTVVGVFVGPVMFGIAAPLWGMQPESVRASLARCWRLSAPRVRSGACSW